MQRGAGPSLAHFCSHRHWGGRLLRQASHQRVSRFPGFRKCLVREAGRPGLAQPHPLPRDTHHSSGRERRSSPAPCAAGPLSDCGFVCLSLPACSRSRSGQCSAGRRTGSPLSGRRKKAPAEGILPWGSASVSGLRQGEMGEGGRWFIFSERRGILLWSESKKIASLEKMSFPFNRSFPIPNSGQVQSMGKLWSSKNTAGKGE